MKREKKVAAVGEENEKAKRLKSEEEEDDEKKTEAEETVTTTTATATKEDLSPEELIAKFPTLQKPLESGTPLLALYFASSWCPDCTPVTPLLNTVYQKSQKEDENKGFELVYVSSDDTKEQLMGNLPDAGGWGFVPFENAQERDDLKRHFGTCAAKEREGLQMTPEERQSGIPTLIVLDCQTGKVITRRGVDDILQDEEEADVVQKWTQALETPASSS